MKKRILLLVEAVLLFSLLQAQTKTSTWLIDFGPEGNTQNCKPTESPDANGAFWNNFTGNNIGSSLDLIDIQGQKSNLAVTTTSTFNVNAGDLMGPTSTGDNIGALAIGSATMDFFFAQNSKPSLKITGLDPNLGYIFYLYGSRLSDETRITTYTLTGATSSSGDLQTSGKDLEGVGQNGNISRVYKTPMLFADQNGEILLEITNKTSAFGYLNALQLDAYTDAKIKIQSITLQGAPITSLGGSVQIAAAISPVNASVQRLNWSVSDPELASVDQNGLVQAKADGLVTITASSMDDPAIKGSCTIQISGQNKASNIMLVDFGPAGNTDNCKPTASPDAHGNYWTNITDNSAGATATLTDIKGNSTAIQCKNLAEFGANPTALMGPLNVSDNLNELSIGTATMDFFYVENKTTSFLLSGLNPDKGYRFTLFGSRITTETRTTDYILHGMSTSSGTLQTSGTDLGGPGNHTNISDTYVSPIIYADQSGNIQLDIKNNASAYGYLNALKLEVFDGIKVPVDHIALSVPNITEADQTVQMTATIFPENAAVKSLDWQVDNPALAVIDSTGLLKALANGTVKVTASSKENPAISSSVSISITGQFNIRQSILVDLGPEGNTDNCKPTPSPDDQGNYWNNFTGNTQGSSLSLTDNQNEATGITLKTTKTFSVNPESLMGPGAVSPLLSPLNIGTASMDFFFVENNTGILELEGLDPKTAYRLRLFGSRLQDEIRKTEFTIAGLTTLIDTLQTSGKDIESAGLNGNISKNITTPIIFSDSTGRIQITLKNAVSTYGYLNALQLENLAIDIVAPTSISIEGEDIHTPGGAQQLTAVVNPQNATIKGVYWSVDNPLIATIDADGKLQAHSNGEVTITARSRQYGSAVVAHRTFTITDQYQQLYITGSALADNSDPEDFLAMHLLKDANNSTSGIFEIYTKLKPSGSFYFKPENNQSGVQFGMGEQAGTLLENGQAFPATGDSIVRIRVNMAANTVDILPIDQITVKGTAGALKLIYSAQGIWSANISMDKIMTDADKTYNFQLNQGDTFAIYHISGTAQQIMTYQDAQRLGYQVEKIQADYNTYHLVLDLNNQTYNMACASLDTKKIVIMGSSVAFGYGATDNHGYNYLYGQLLEKRYKESRGPDWNLINHAISGNNTQNVLDRWNRDLALGCGKYVIIGLSLGNEDIHESQDKEATYNQFKENLLKMMAMARADGMVPVINNNYTRSDYTAEDYNYIKKMDLFIHELDAPSMNLLGAVDDGNGHWASSFRFDDLHPNDAGHEEMFYSIVPSLFDALDEGKALPENQNSAGSTLNNTDSVTQLYFLPENIVHSFTLNFTIKTSGSGKIAYFNQLNNTGTLQIDSTNGYLVYTGPGGQKIKASVAINDDKWHAITLTHFYARGTTCLYIDGIKAAENNERLMPSYFYFNDMTGPKVLQIKNLFFYRAGMSPEAIAAMQAGEMLKSSMEIYAPLDQGNLINLAQSTNALQSKKTVIENTGGTQTPSGPGEATPDQNIVAYPNPVKTRFKFGGLTAGKTYLFYMYNINGKKVMQNTISSGDSISLKGLPAGKYFILLQDKQSSVRHKFSIIKE